MVSGDFVKVVAVTPIPTPYRDPFWSAVARQPGVELHVFYCSAGKDDRPWEASWSREYDAEILPGYNLNAWRGAAASCFWNPSILRRLRKGGYDALVCGGYNHLTMLAGMRYAVRHRVPYFLMCESHLQQPRRFWRRWFKQRFVRRVVTLAAGGFPAGTLARDYLLHYGADPQNLAIIPNVPDVAKLAKSVGALRKGRGQLRREYGLGDYPIVLFAGRLIPRKGAHVLIRAFRNASSGNDAHLVIAGAGPERRALEKIASECCLEGRVRFAGFVQPADMSKWYAMADLFVLPSSETWGVVVLEALASGLPVIVTNEVGCYPDAINDPSVGTVVACRNQEQLAASIRQRVEEPVSEEEVTRVWAPIRERFEYPVLARRMLQLLHRGCNSSSLTKDEMGKT